MSGKILVTGAAGFIGSHTVQKLLTQGHHVIGVDNFHDYYSPDRKRSNLCEIRETPDSPNFFFQEGDIRQPSFLKPIFERENITTVVNLAAMAGVRFSLEEPQLYFDVNVSGTLNLLQACVTYEVKHLVLASTSSVYGESNHVPFVETMSCDRPLAPYSASKRSAEMLAFTYHHLFGLNTTVLRFFTVYGPRNRPDMMAYKVLDSIYFDKPLTLFSGGEMWRDWTYVDDIVEGITSAVRRPMGYEILNLGRGERVKLSDFISLLEELCGKRAHLEVAPKMDTDMEHTLADIGKARRLLDYNPKIDVSQGVENLWRWYREKVLR